ncbi:PREDICTED: signal peptidase complex-like protein DTM1 isoform X2 [Nelumbo nucifera]|uniref:Signal peptidase complex-like protein DTM1 n=2 Tax=Nelumbo nucifera TaxID=4432 RepID=A0A822XX27_NELNU|nr:PREDICTED: signal peptidase complex-like protein DTM1 isoform X2 [Nelumbo nucifera]DAD21948.1 TPA_asm: hypothetical protein HUJ06_023411 [Nelumbo nucifera]
MMNDAVLRSSLLYLGIIVLLIGIFTYSFKKMMVTYFFGLFAISGVLLPDWEFFDRDFSQWFCPVTIEHGADSSSPQISRSTGFKIYPLRLALYAIVYGFGLYKWWVYVSN